MKKLFLILLLILLINTSCSAPLEPEVFIDNFSVEDTQEKEYTGYVTFWFDDGYESTYKIAFPELEKREWKAVIAVVGDREYAIEAFYPKKIITWNELEILEKSGWEISSHSTHHLHLNNYGEEDGKIFEKEIADSSKMLRDLGFEITSFTFPYGEQGGRVGQKYVKDNYDYWRSGEKGINELPAWKNLLSFSLSSDTSINEIKQQITQAENSGWLIINLHDISKNNSNSWNQSTKQFMELLEIVEKSNLQVVIPEQIYSKYGYAETDNIDFSEKIWNEESTIKIGKINVDTEIKKADIQDTEWDFSELEEYPLWISSTPLFGNSGLSAIIGHRQWGDTPKVFARLDELEKYDIIIVNKIKYSVQYILIVKPEEIYATYNNLNKYFYNKDINGLMLITCTPYGKATQRLLIIAEQKINR